MAVLTIWNMEVCQHCSQPRSGQMFLCDANPTAPDGLADEHEFIFWVSLVFPDGCILGE